MKTIRTVEGHMYIQPSKRSPIMVIDGGKKRALEEHIKDAIGTNLTIVNSEIPRWRKVASNEVIITPSSGGTYATGSIADIAPHTKKVRITIEIEV